MDDVLVGLIVLMLGAAVCFFGVRVWFVMLPIWGFIAGFFVGAIAVQEIVGDGFLSTATGWVVGVVAGLAFAVLSYVVWYAGVVVAAASVGAQAGAGLMAALDVRGDTSILIAALIGAIVFAIITIVLDLPIYLVVFNTALAGATAVVAGAMLALDQVNLDQLGRGSGSAMVDESWGWFLAWAVVAALGIAYQLTDMAEVRLPDERLGRAQYV